MRFYQDGITRRTLIAGASLSLALIAIPLIVIVAKKSKIIVARIEAWVPRLLFFPECIEVREQHCLQKEVSTVMLSQSSDNEKISVHFSNGKELIFPARLSYKISILDDSQHKPSRAGILVKNLSSWILDSVYRSIRHTKTIRDYDRVRQDFTRFQEGPVLDSVTLSALCQFLDQVHQSRRVRGASWNEDETRFQVY
ncbi:MAG: hypothetical protein ACYTF1_17090 [Planctomycetota bacterium]|jgi:hypothetical protein